MGNLCWIYRPVYWLTFCAALCLVPLLSGCSSCEPVSKPANTAVALWTEHLVVVIPDGLLQGGCQGWTFADYREGEPHRRRELLAVSPEAASTLLLEWAKKKEAGVVVFPLDNEELANMEHMRIWAHQLTQVSEYSGNAFLLILTPDDAKIRLQELVAFGFRDGTRDFAADYSSYWTWATRSFKAFLQSIGANDN